MSDTDLRYTWRVPLEQIVELVYVDSKGLRICRRVVPDRIWFGRTDWVPEPQWLLDAYDPERHVTRSYPMSRVEVHSVNNVAGVSNGPADSSSAGRVPVHR